MGYIEMRNSCKTYKMGETKIYANRDVSFSIEKGELAIILGSSGAGKSTALNILGGMDTNDSGKVIIDGKDISNYNARQLTTYRRNDVGFVFQFYNLVQNLTSKENVELASEIVKDALDPVQVLKDVGLSKRINNFPAQLSGGEQQRVAIARAIAKNPKILLCDEPTGALDYQTGKQVLQILQDMCRKKGAISEHEVHTLVITVLIILESTAHRFHNRKSCFMSSFHKRIQIRNHLIAERNRFPDIFLAVAVHPRLCYRVVNVGGMNGKSGLENTILNPAHKQFRFRGRSVKTADVTALVGYTGHTHAQNSGNVVFQRIPASQIIPCPGLRISLNPAVTGTAHNVRTCVVKGFMHGFICNVAHNVGHNGF